jgi:uncharacterized protein (TIGR00297 family)
MNYLTSLFKVPATDWLLIVFAFAIILLIIVMAEIIRRILKIPSEFTRKLVHLFVGVLLCIIPLRLQTAIPMIGIAAFFVVGNFVSLQLGWFKSIHGDRHSYGTVFYPLSFLLLVVFFWPHYPSLLIIPMAVMAFGDAAAGLVGELLNSPHQYKLIGEAKSLEGSLTMWVVSSIVVGVILFYIPLWNLPPLSTQRILLIALVVGFIATVAEAISGYGSDNLSIPFFTAVTTAVLLYGSLALQQQFIWGILMAAVASVISWKVGFLDASGAVTAFLLGMLIFGLGGWQWTCPILIFFVLSSLLSKMGKHKKAQLTETFEKGDRRDWAQVLANGGVGGILILVSVLLADEIWYLVYLAFLAAATADSWGTEIGTYFRGQPRLITTFKKVQPGTSGGVSIIGSVGGFIGAFLIGLCGWYFLQTAVSFSTIVPLITAAGILGSLFDSFIGALFQAQYLCSICGNVTERVLHCNETPTTLLRGKVFLNNDSVNFIANTSAAMVVWVVWQYIN